MLILKNEAIILKARRRRKRGNFQTYFLTVAEIWFQMWLDPNEGRDYKCDMDYQTPGIFYCNIANSLK